MTPDVVIHIGKEALWVLLQIGAPLLLSALIVGLVIGMLQAATQINEMTLSFIPKVLVLMATLCLTGSWMLQTLINYTRSLIESIPGLIG
ncbi:MAG: flagellar biosynthesis protein FliQ [Gammaproteobacteria bacterium]|nr:flagellar biosynthesis protein FliQ [Gammaproteobacteria bacterium]